MKNQEYCIHRWDEFSSNPGAPALLSVVGKLLEKSGWKKAECHQASLVVLVSLHRDIQRMPVADARVFLGLLRSGGKVLFFHMGSDSAGQNEASLCDWFFSLGVLSEPEVLKKRLKKLALWLKDENAEAQWKIPDLRLLKKVCAKRSEASEGFDTDLEFLARLYEKAGSFRYDRVEHDIHSRIYALRMSSNKEDQQYEPIGRSVKEKAEVDDYHALWSGLRHAALYEQDKEGEDGFRILLIDDYPEKIRDKIEAALRVFGIHAPVDYVGVSDEVNRDAIHKLMGYQSAGKLPENKFRVSKGGGTSEEKSLTDLFNGYRTFLVDLLMPGKSGQEETIGIQLIGALRRAAIDSGERVPDIIALSMADDVDKVQAAMRQGAEGYIFKPRVLSLPGLLGRLGARPHSPSIYARRNFRSLYVLPEQTRRLLKNLKVPRIRYDRMPGKLPDDERQVREQALVQADKLARLLQRLPKTDIHVHVGSCMSPEFLVAASFVMLLRYQDGAKVKESYSFYARFWNGEQSICFPEEIRLDGLGRFCFRNSESGIERLAIRVRRFLARRIRKDQHNPKFRLFRSILHKGLGIPSHWSQRRVLEALDKKSDIDLFLFLLSHGQLEGGLTPGIQQCDDIIRFFLLFQAINGYSGGAVLRFFLPGNKEFEVLDWFNVPNGVDWTIWKELHCAFYESDDSAFRLLEENGWQLPRESESKLVRCQVNLGRQQDSLLDDIRGFDEDPISWLLATGTRCSSLLGYLEGCEFSGAEHLRHPWLIHLYAQQAAWQFTQQGILYAELRAALSGYENRQLGFRFEDVCSCVAAAFETACKAVKAKHFRTDTGFPDWLWEGNENDDTPFPFTTKRLKPFFPLKVGLTLTGKRHKPIRQMLREISAAVVFHSPRDDEASSEKFVGALRRRQIAKCMI